VGMAHRGAGPIAETAPERLCSGSLQPPPALFEGHHNV
jgi:hypothetical protein